MLNYKEDKSFRSHLENFIVLRFLQNNNQETADLEKAFTQSLTQVFGTSCFETLRQVGLAQETSQNKLKPIFRTMIEKTDVLPPNLEFDFILTDKPKKLKIPDLDLKLPSKMGSLQTIFQHFYKSHIKNKYKACAISMTMGGVELFLTQGPKKVILRVFPFEALILQIIGGRKDLRVGQIYEKIKNSNQETNRILFFKGISEMRDKGLIIVSGIGFSEIGGKQIVASSIISFNRKFISKFEDGQSKLLFYR